MHYSNKQLIGALGCVWLAAAAPAAAQSKQLAVTANLTVAA